MFKSVRIQNFRCLKDVEVPLRPLTVLIGPNDSGKSAFLAALHHLVEATPFTLTDFWRLNTDSTVKVETTDKQHGAVRVAGGQKGTAGRSMPGAQYSHTGLDGIQTLASLASDKRRWLTPCGFYQLPVGGVPMESAGYADTGAPPAIGGHGELIPALLDHLLRRDRKRFFGVNETVRKLVPGLEQVEIATPQAQTRRVDLVIETGLRIPGDDASAGIRLLLFFVALAYHPCPPKFIFIEEPENGIHPKRLEDVMRLLREITQGKHGDHAAQVILTTHSPHLLDYVDTEHDQVLVFRRNEDGSRTAEPADAERLKNFLDEFMLGEVWFNEGEAGLVRRGT